MTNYAVATTDPYLGLTIKFVRNSSLVNAYLTEYNNYFGHGMVVPDGVVDDDYIIELVMTKFVTGFCLGILIEEIPDY